MKPLIFVLTTLTTLFFTFVGCKEPPTPTATDSGTVTLEDGSKLQIDNLAEKPPKLTEQVEKEIYKSLNHRRKMIKAIKNASGPNRGIQQMRDELLTLTKGFMVRYDLTKAEIDKILNKGDSKGWD